ncbi:unnamed protein product [Closterium sp. NIES-64]|nr:unnamed protein product [Closterium sp. NIES-64]
MSNGSRGESSATGGDDAIAVARHVARQLLDCYGPAGCGIVAIKDVPHVEAVRLQLLPLARRLALMHPSCRNAFLREHGVGSDLPLSNPKRPVSSFFINVPLPSRPLPPRSTAAAAESKRGMQSGHGAGFRPRVAQTTTTRPEQHPTATPTNNTCTALPSASQQPSQASSQQSPSPSPPLSSDCPPQLDHPLTSLLPSLLQPPSHGMCAIPTATSPPLSLLRPLMLRLASHASHAALLVALLCDAALNHSLPPCPPCASSLPCPHSLVLPRARVAGKRAAGSNPPSAAASVPGSAALPAGQGAVCCACSSSDGGAAGCGFESEPRWGAEQQQHEEEQQERGEVRLVEAMVGGTGKARLIHYHAWGELEWEGGGVEQRGRRRKGRRGGDESGCGQVGQVGLWPVQGPSRASIPCSSSLPSHVPLWQQWHYDYGLFTALVAPLYVPAASPSDFHLACPLATASLASSSDLSASTAASRVTSEEGGVTLLGEKQKQEGQGLQQQEGQARR